MHLLKNDEPITARFLREILDEQYADFVGRVLESVDAETIALLARTVKDLEEKVTALTAQMEKRG